MAQKEKNIQALVRSGTVLHEVLSPHKEAIAERWKGIVHGTYPFDTVGFLRTQTNQFANPVGHRTNEAALAIVDVVFSDHPAEEPLLRAVEEIIQVRAIQEFSPEAAVGIFFAIKEIVREIVDGSGRGAECRVALQAMDSRIDAVVLMAFGVYARLRERLHLIRVDEIKRSTSQLQRLVNTRAGAETPAE